MIQLNKTETPLLTEIHLISQQLMTSGSLGQAEGLFVA